MKKIITVLIVILLISFALFAQSPGDYRSVGNGNWNDATKWEIFNGSNWVSATSYPGQNPGTGAVNILAFHEIKITASVPHPIASLWIQFFFDEYGTNEYYFGTLTFRAESSVSLTVSGNIDISGILNVDDQTGSKSHMLFIGGSLNGILDAINADDNLSVIFNSTVPNRTISGGTFQDVTFNGNTFSVYAMFINGRVTFINGIVKTFPEEGPNPTQWGPIHFRKGATWSGASNLSYVDGWVSKEGDEPFTFPIGENGIYAPLTISAPVGQTEIFMAKYKRASGSDLGGITDPGLFNVSQCEYWDLMPANGNYIKNYPLDITVGWNSSSGCGISPYITNVSDVTMAHFNGTTWDRHGGTATGTISNGSVTWSGVTTFSPFTIGNIGTCKTPSGFSATNITGNSATISWSPEPGAVSYDVYYDDGPSAPVSFWTNAAAGTTSTSLNISGLIQSSKYYYRIRANCSSGSSSYMQSEFTTLTVCDRPAGLTTSNITDISATLSWAPVPGAISYHVEYSQYSEWIPVSSVITSTSYTLGGLSPASYYYWRVRANCSEGYSHYGYSDLFYTYRIFCPDVYELNNSSGQAKAINLGNTISATISSTTDVDWFKVTTPNNSNITLQVILSNLPADFDLYVYDQRFKLVGSSTAFGNSNEVVIYNSNARKATYYIKIAGKNGAYDNSQCYTLLAQALSGAGTASRGSDPVNVISGNANIQLLYPNPASEFVYVGFNSTIEGPTNVQVFNATGQLTKQVAIKIIKGYNQVKIAVNDIKEGMYLLRINKGDLSIIRKFVIAR